MRRSTRKKLFFSVAFSVIFSLSLTYFAEASSIKLAKCAALWASNKDCDPVKKDVNGVAVVRYPEPVGSQRYAISIADLSMDSYDRWIMTHDRTAKTEFLNAADWIVNNIDKDGINRVTFDWATYKLEAPWQSGMAQGLMLKVLQRAYEITGDEKYDQAAKRVLNSFYIDVKDGGVTYTDEWWYEEYANMGGSEPHVLNGMMYATLGIYDYYNRTHDPTALDLFQKGVDSLKQNMGKYEHPDGSGYTYYDLSKNPAWEYQEVHVRLANELYEATGDPTFKEYAERWQGFREWSSFGLWLSHPLNVTLMALGINAILALSVILAILFYVPYLLRSTASNARRDNLAHTDSGQHTASAA
jgi:hypothetical protein